MSAFVVAVLAQAAAHADPQSQQSAQQTTTQETTPPAAKPAAQQQAASEIDEVTVTGSRIRRTEFNNTSPVMIITAEEATLEGLLSTTEVLQTNTLAAGSQQINDQTTGFVTENGPGANTVALRGLGSSRTLILLNGRRLSPAGARGQLAAVDLNTIPTTIVQRTEILKDGASSVYGSDAIAGVINLITRSNLDGGGINLTGTSVFDGGGEQRRFSAAWGKQFDDGGFSVSYEYFKREPLYVKDRDYLNCAQDRLANVTTNTNSFFYSSGGTLDLIDPTTGQSKCFNILESVIDRLGTGSFVTTQGRFVPDSTATAGGGALGLDLAGWRRVGLSFAQIAALKPTLTQAQQYQLWRDSQSVVPNAPARFGNRTFISPVTRNSAFAEGHYKFGETTEVFGELLYTKRESAQRSWRQLFPNVSAANPSNPFGVTARSIPVIPTNQEQEVEFRRGVLGLRGEFSLGSLENWNWEVFAQRTESKAKYTNDIIYNDRVVATTGSTACNAAAITISGPVTCQAINWFRPQMILTGEFTPEEKAFLFTRETGNTTYDQTLYGASINGNIFSLPAGEVGMVLGVEGRKDSIDDTPGFNARNSNLWGQTSAGRTAGTDKVKEAFTELEIPLLADLPGVKRLSFNGSYRWTDYDSYGSDHTYKAGLNWQIVDSIRLRGSYGTSFRAPALYELFLANQTGFLGQSSVDPCINWDTSSNPNIVKNCGPSGAGLPTGWLNPNSSALVITGGGAGVLDAETSNNSTIGLVWTPESIPLNVAVDWWRIEVANEVAQFGAGNIVFRCYDSPEYPNNEFCNLFTRETNRALPNFGQILQVRNSYVNISNEVVEGVDWTARFNKRFGKNLFRANASVSYRIKDSYQLTSTSAEQINRGQIYNNKWVASLDFGLERGPWTVTWNVDMFSRASNDEYYGGNVFGWRGFSSCATVAATSTTCVSAKYDQTAAFNMNHDVSVRYSADKWSAVFGISNIFDQDPPLVSTGSGATRIGNAVAISNYDVLGRRAFASLEYRF